MPSDTTDDGLGEKEVANSPNVENPESTDGAPVFSGVGMKEESKKALAQFIFLIIGCFGLFLLGRELGLIPKRATPTASTAGMEKAAEPRKNTAEPRKNTAAKGVESRRRQKAQRAADWTRCSNGAMPRIMREMRLSRTPLSQLTDWDRKGIEDSVLVKCGKYAPKKYYYHRDYVPPSR
jgi:hypothetical protein